MTDRGTRPLGRLHATATRAAFGVIVLCAAATACSSGDDTTASTPTSAAAEVTSTESPTTEAVAAQDEAEATSETPGPGLADQYGQRQREVLSVTVSDEGASAEVWGAGSLRTRDFGGIEMRSIATVELGEGLGDRTPLTEASVARDTTFVFEEGREIHELTAPDRFRNTYQIRSRG